MQAEIEACKEGDRLKYTIASNRPTAYKSGEPKSKEACCSIETNKHDRHVVNAPSCTPAYGWHKQPCQETSFSFHVPSHMSNQLHEGRSMLKRFLPEALGKATRYLSSGPVCGKFRNFSQIPKDRKISKL